ncbi:hypothetical protein SAMN05421754_103421 [Nitrosomonas sp. Nm58]|nr:hypothetical protein SAMN05421754_103421 [Nitrosomonas sp. Nm58]
MLDCNFDNGEHLYCEGQLVSSSVLGIWRGRGELNVPPSNLIGTDSDLQLIIRVFALEFTLWSRPSTCQGAAGSGGFSTSVFHNDGIEPSAPTGMLEPASQPQMSPRALGECLVAA